VRARVRRDRGAWIDGELARATLVSPLHSSTSRRPTMEKRRILSFLGLTMAAGAGAGCLPSNAPARAPGDAQPTVTAASCKELLAGDEALDSGAYQLRDATGNLYRAWCDMIDDSGGWTLVVKVDGSQPTSHFNYDDPLWENSDTFDDSVVDTGRSEAKYRAFSQVGFSQVRVVFARPTDGSTMGTITLDVGSTSFQKLMQSGFIDAQRASADWLALVPGAILEGGCNRGGINNFTNDPTFRTRIGMLGNNSWDCDSPDSFIGVGGGGGRGDGCYPPGHVALTAGLTNGAVCTANPPIPDVPAFAYVYVR
jgi:hypothetical protein